MVGTPIDFRRRMDRPSALDRRLPPPVPPAPRADLRPAPGRKAAIARAADHAASLSGDLREWVELRIELVRAEIREKVEEVQAMAKHKGIGVGLLVAALVLALYALGFLLAAASAGLASWLGHPAWGHLATGGLLLLIVGVLAWAGQRRLSGNRTIEATLAPPDSPPSR
jgi:hypothetical protein